MQRVAVLDHGMGNLRSVAKAFEAAGARVAVTARRADVDASDVLCVPGQGIFGRCMWRLRDSGLDEVVRAWVTEGRPYVGICLGMQVLFGSSAEAVGDAGLGILDGAVVRLRDDLVRVPHIGWNTVGDTFFYFDHSYAPRPSDPGVVRGWCEHGERFAAWVEAGALTAVQFHPEKSGRAGIAFLARALAPSPSRAGA